MIEEDVVLVAVNFKAEIFESAEPWPCDASPDANGNIEHSLRFVVELESQEHL